MAGAVPRKTMNSLQKLVQGARKDYPWESVLDSILESPMASDRLVHQGLLAQRDWIMRGGRETPRKRLAVQGKTILARLMVRTLFFVLYTGAVCALLVLLKQVAPKMDLYIVLNWLQQAFPGVFPSR